MSSKDCYTQSMIGLCGYCNLYQPMVPITRKVRITGCVPYSLRMCIRSTVQSATDRWPLSVIHDLMSMMWGQTDASAIVNGALGLNTWQAWSSFNKKTVRGFFQRWSSFRLLWFVGPLCLIAPNHNMDGCDEGIPSAVPGDVPK